MSDLVSLQRNSRNGNNWVTVPKQVVDALGYKPASKFKFSMGKDGSFIYTPVSNRGSGKNG